MKKENLGLYIKLHAAKQHIGKVAKNAKNPHFKNNYADINALINEVEPVLIENGLLLLQPITDGFVRSIILDVESGESMVSEMKLPEILDPQKIGSAITYFRRYTLQSLLSLQAVDDDGNMSVEAIKTQKPTIAMDRFEKALQMVADEKLSKDDLIKKMSQFTLNNVQEAALLVL